jgi:translation initiation factor IF-3
MAHDDLVWERLAYDAYVANESITAENVRVIGADGTQLGVMATADALRLARQAGLDLVVINPRGAPPICKIMSFAELKRSMRRPPN